MSHLHVPDGLLPLWLWGPGLLLVLGMLALASRSATPQRVAYQGALGALMLAANALPLGPLEYHLTLSGPIGILLGPAGAFQAAFAVSVILALLGHGGFTVVGLNTLVLGAGAAVARPVYTALVAIVRPRTAMAWGTASGQAVAGGLWLLVMAATARFAPSHPGAAGLGHHTESPAAHFEVLAAFAFPLWLVGTAVEAMVAWGIGRFLERVHPALLPGGDPSVVHAEVA
ncbi:MAG TPA: energy-coupling factor ABC transporter permease [Candidatus Eisenbacteria bacterium]|jgi:cobalt/nickel transport system permease protein